MLCYYYGDTCVWFYLKVATGNVKFYEFPDFKDPVP